MAIIDRYIGTAVASSVIVVLLVVAALLMFGAIAGDLDDIGRGRYTFGLAMLVAVYALPGQLYEAFPVTALLGTIFGLGILATHSELTAMRSAGIAATRILTAVLKAALLLIVCAVAIGETAAPWLSERSTELRVKALTKQVEVDTSTGLWARQGADFVHVRHVASDGTLNDLEIYELDSSSELQRVVHAKRAEHGDNGWTLTGVTITSFAQDQVSREVHAMLRWQSLIQPELINVVRTEPERMSTPELHAYIGYLKNNGLDARRYESTFWAKLFRPLTIVAMVVLAVPFVFGSLRSVGMGARGFAGFAVGVAFYLVNQIAGQMGIVFQIPPILSASVPTLALMGLAVVMLRRLT